MYSCNYLDIYSLHQINAHCFLHTNVDRIDRSHQNKLLYRFNIFRKQLIIEKIFWDRRLEYNYTLVEEIYDFENFEINDDLKNKEQRKRQLSFLSFRKHAIIKYLFTDMCVSTIHHLHEYFSLIQRPRIHYFSMDISSHDQKAFVELNRKILMLYVLQGLFMEEFRKTHIKSLVFVFK